MWAIIQARRWRPLRLICNMTPFRVLARRLTRYLFFDVVLATRGKISASHIPIRLSTDSFLSLLDCQIYIFSSRTSCRGCPRHMHSLIDSDALLPDKCRCASKLAGCILYRRSLSNEAEQRDVVPLLIGRNKRQYIYKTERRQFLTIILRP